MEQAEILSKLAQALETLPKATKEGAAEGCPWTEVKQESGVTIYSSRPPSAAINCMKGETIIKCSLEKLSDIIWDLELRQKWDPMFLGGDIVQVLGDHKEVVRYRFKSPSMVVANRDLLLVRSLERKEGMLLLPAVSVTHADGPDGTVDKFVRGEIFVSGFVAEDLGDGTCRLSYIVQLDPKGWVPSAIANLVSVKQPLCLVNIRQFAETP